MIFFEPLTYTVSSSNCFLAPNELNLRTNSIYMLQRVQSLLLLGVSIISVILFFIPLYERVPLGADMTVIPTGISKSAILQLINGSVGVLAFLTIFLYKKRNIQIRLGNLVILITCVFIALVFFMADTMSTENQKIHYLIGSYLPLIQVLLAYLATRYIKKDEELVRSADRLR